LRENIHAAGLKCHPLRIVVEGNLLAARFFVGQALLPVLLCCADIERDRQECLSYPKQVRADGDVDAIRLVWQYLRAQNAVEEL